MAEHGTSTVFALTAPPNAGRLDAWLAGELPLSRNSLQGLIKAGEVRVDGRPARSSQRLAGGEAVTVRVPPAPPSDLVPQDIPLPLLHVDDHVVVVDKPAGLVVHPGRGHPDGTLVNALLHLLREVRAPVPPADLSSGDDDGDDEAWPPDPSRPGIVHRLDRGTSGVLVVARTLRALTLLAEQFAAHSVERRYRALVWGRLPAGQGVVDAPLARHPSDRLRFAVVPGGRRAVTHWKVLGVGTFGIAGDPTGGALSLVECRLETGRTHQIRVHLTHLGHPLVGDPLYGRQARLPARLLEACGQPDHQLLHAACLGFDHPDTGQRCRFETPEPADFRCWLDALGLP